MAFPHMVIFPALLLFTLLAFTYVGDGLKCDERKARYRAMEELT